MEPTMEHDLMFDIIAPIADRHKALSTSHAWILSAQPVHADQDAPLSLHLNQILPNLFYLCALPKVFWMLLCLPQPACSTYTSHICVRKLWLGFLLNLYPLGLNFCWLMLDSTTSSAVIYLFHCPYHHPSNTFSLSIFCLPAASSMRMMFTYFYCLSHRLSTTLQIVLAVWSWNIQSWKGKWHARSTLEDWNLYVLFHVISFKLLRNWSVPLPRVKVELDCFQP